jgi:hypothetical protein
MQAPQQAQTEKQTPASLTMNTMKTTPWPLVRWGAATALYLATLGIAIDQVRTKNAALADAEARLAEIHRISDSMGQRIRKLDEGNQAMMQATEQLKEGLLAEQERQHAAAITRRLMEARAAARAAVQELTGRE